MTLSPCTHCFRHIDVREKRCPFCERGAPRAASTLGARSWRITRRAMFYLGATTVAACGTEAGPLEPPPPPEAIASPQPIAEAPADPAPSAESPASAEEIPTLHTTGPPSPEVLAISDPPPDTVDDETRPRERPPRERPPRERPLEEQPQEDPGLGHLPGGPATGYGGPPEGPGLGGAAAATTIGTVTQQSGGELDLALVIRTLRVRLAAFRACYQRMVRSDPTRTGSMVLAFTVEPSGIVSAASIEQDSLGVPAVSACVIGVTRRLRFSPGPEEGAASFTVPLTFSRRE